MTPTTESPGGEGMLAVIATAVIGIVTLEAAFVAVGSWWMVPCLLLGVLLATGLVIFSVLHTIDSDTPARATPKAQPQAKPDAVPARRAVRPKVVAGH